MAGNPRLRASVVCEAEGHLLVVRLRDPKTGVVALYPPGGAIEDGETPFETAERETREETGLRVRVDPKVELVDRYPFVWGGEEYDCTTHYFAAELDEPFVKLLGPVNDTDYNLGPAWVPADEALAELAQFPAICAATRRVLGQARRARWRRDPKVNASPAAMLLMVHDHFRVAAQRLLLLAEEPGTLESGWLARSFRPLADTLHHHHHLEEMLLFHRIAEGPALTSDHKELTAAIETVQAVCCTPSPSAFTTLHRFHDVLVDHLDREEAIVVPMLAALSPTEVAALFA